MQADEKNSRWNTCAFRDGWSDSYSGRNGNYVRIIQSGALLILGVLGIELHFNEHSQFLSE